MNFRLNDHLSTRQIKNIILTNEYGLAISLSADKFDFSEALFLTPDEVLRLKRFLTDRD